MTFIEEWLQSGHSTIKAYLVESFRALTQTTRASDDQINLYTWAQVCQISHSLSSFKPLTLLADSLHNDTSPVSATANRDHLSPLLLHTSPPCNLKGSFLLGKSFWSRAGDEMNITTLSPASVGIAYYRATVAFLGQFFCNKWCSVWRFARITDHIFTGHWTVLCAFLITPTGLLPILLLAAN